MRILILLLGCAFLPPYVDFPLFSAQSVGVCRGFRIDHGLFFHCLVRLMVLFEKQLNYYSMGDGEYRRARFVFGDQSVVKKKIAYQMTLW